MKKQKKVSEDNNPQIESKQTDSSAEISEEDKITAESEESAQKVENLSEETSEEQSAEIVENQSDTETTTEVVPPKSFRDRINDVYNYFGGFFERNNVMQRFIGLFLIFISFVTWKNNSLDDKINFSHKWKEYSESVSIGKMVLIVGGIFVVLTLLKELVVKLRKINYDSYIFIGGLLLFGVTALWRCVDFYLIIAITIVCVALVNSFTKHTDFMLLKRLPKHFYTVLLAVLTVGMITYISVTTICAYRSFGTSTFDMGIFIQMYHSMREEFSLVTTCERNKFLSHFAVHCSPAYYLLYPVYALFPYAETLLIAQAVIIMSGVIPLCLICRKYGFSKIPTFLFGIMYIFSVSLICPCYYDFHENAFLPPLLLWFLYAFEKDKKVLMYVFMVLVLSVKEDAGLYLMCIGMYMLLSGRNKRHGFIVFALSVAYFALVTGLMGKYGEGVMTSRTFGNLMQDHSKGFGEVIKTVLTNPAYFITQLFTEEKFVFMITMLTPMLFVPFITKKSSRLLITVPFLIMNLATGYGYAFNIGYQYVLGTTACLLYVVVINSNDMSRETFRKVVPAMAVASFLVSFGYASDKIYKIERYLNNTEKYDTIKAYLDTVPEDASVQATTWLVPQLAQRKEIYMIDTADSENNTDFVVIQTDYMDDWKSVKIEKLISDGYWLYCEAEGQVQIYVSPDYEFKE